MSGGGLGHDEMLEDEVGDCLVSVVGDEVRRPVDEGEVEVIGPSATD